MRTYSGQVEAMQLAPTGQTAARLACPGKAVPAPGQYLLAQEPEAILATALFPAAITPDGFVCAPPVPPEWSPGMQLRLRGPAGHGFELPASSTHIALAVLGDSPARLLALAAAGLAQERAVALFSDGRLPDLPASLEAFPLSALPEAIDWADYLAIDLPVEKLPDWRRQLRLPEETPLPWAGQALISLPMPCGGRAECGACALLLRRKWKLACKDGPVFDLRELP
jgi:dihydroorotate dehydrogenase electron transfer subunit